MTATELRCISKRFGHLQAVDDVSLQLDNGCRVALLGPSGAGKTTLLRLLAGLEQPDSGELLESGVDVTEHLPHQRRGSLTFAGLCPLPTIDGRAESASQLGPQWTRQPHASQQRIAETTAAV